MHTATVSSKYQILVPKKIREQLDIKPGQQFIFITKGEGLELIPKKELKELRGVLIGANTSNIRDRKDRE